MKKIINKDTSFRQNLYYSFQQVWCFKKIYIVAVIMLIVFKVIGSTLAIYTPSLIIGAVEKKFAVLEVLLGILGLVGANCIYLCADSVLQHKVRTEYMTKFEYHTKKQIMKICMNLDYSMLEDPQTSTLREKAESAGTSAYYLLINLRL